MAYYIRKAKIGDCESVLELIRELARYEKLEDQVTATVADLVDVVFRKKTAGLLVADDCGRLVGYALYFLNISTFKCREGIYVGGYLRKTGTARRGNWKRHVCRAGKACEKKTITGVLNGHVSIGMSRLKRIIKIWACAPMEGWTQFRVDESRFDSFLAKCEDKKQH